MMVKDLKHILICCDQYPTNNDPVFSFVEQMVNAFAQKGIRVSVVAPQSLTKHFLRKVPLHPRYVKHQKEKNGIIEIFQPYKLTFGNRFPKINSFFTNSALRTALRKIKTVPNVCYGHFWHCALAIYPYAKKNNIPLFVSSGEADIWKETKVAKECMLDFLDYYKGVFFVSSKNKKESAELGYLNNKEHCVIPNSIDPLLFYKKNKEELRACYGIPKDVFIVIFVGGFIERKGPNRVANALKNMGNANIKAFFVGREHDGVKFDFDYDGILFKGVVSHNKLVDYLNMADVFVLPTLAEGCCNAIIEAMACGLPIISSNCDFNDDILDDSCSIRVNPVSISEIETAIEKLYIYPELRKKMGQAALSKASLMTTEKRAETILNFIEKCIKRSS